jgi:predicted DNA-binding transcriptional regulator AlpA
MQASNPTAPVQLNGLAFLRKPDLVSATSLSYSTLYRLIRMGRFPAPIRLSERTSAWRASDVLDWINSHAAGNGTQAEAVTKKGGQ